MDITRWRVIACQSKFDQYVIIEFHFLMALFLAIL
jgi:hypothetical protein